MHKHNSENVVREPRQQQLMSLSLKGRSLKLLDHGDLLSLKVALIAKDVHDNDDLDHHGVDAYQLARRTPTATAYQAIAVHPDGCS